MARDARYEFKEHPFDAHVFIFQNVKCNSFFFFGFFLVLKELMQLF